MSIKHVIPTGGTISLPDGMSDSSQYTSLRGIWCKYTAVGTKHMNYTDQSRALLLLGLVHSIESKIEKLGQLESGPGGPGTSDVGQLTYDGRSGLSSTIQIIWKDEDRTPNQLKKEMQWLIHQGFAALQDEWIEKDVLLSKLMKFSTIDS